MNCEQDRGTPLGAKSYSRWILSAAAAGLLALAASATPAAADHNDDDDDGGGSVFSLISSFSAGTDCREPDSLQTFSLFGDYDWYVLAPGGSFESGTRSWSRSGSAYVVRYDHGYDLYPGAGNMSMWMRSGSRATSPKFCVHREMPHGKFMAQAQAGTGRLDVEVRAYDRDYDLTDSARGSINASDHEEWAPSRAVSMLTQDMEIGKRGYVDIRYYSYGEWAIDDVLIDPYRRG